MSKVVIFAEKPSQAKAYADAFSIYKRHKTHIELKTCNTFPDGATITWGIGHLVELKMPQDYKKEWGVWNLDNLPIIPNPPEYKIRKDTKKQYDKVQELFNDATTIVNATDIDREGSNIFYSVYIMTGAKNKNIKRLWINSLEVDEIRKGFNNLLDNDKDLLMYKEAQTRQIADWLVGINASQLYSLNLDTTMSVGRVQSPTVYMIYKRQKEIENFKSEPFFELLAEFSNEKGEYQGKADIKRQKNADTIQKLLDGKDINMEHDKGTIQSVTKKTKKQKPRKLHSLSTLQSRLNKLYKYSPDSVLKTAQSLYEKKLLTYPRTDCNHITTSEFAYLTDNLDNYKNILNDNLSNVTLNSVSPSKRYVDNKKVQEHYAIIPTKTANKEKVSKLNEKERNVFMEVLKTTLAIYADPHVYEETEIITNVKGVTFKTKGKIEKNIGWKLLFKNEIKNKEDKPLPDLIKNEDVQSKMSIKKGKTQPPKPYTEGQLINLMKTSGKQVENESESEILKEVEGIGTEATRAGIIETIKRNDYIKIKKNIVHVTKKGEILCKAIDGTLLSSPSMTAKWESYLTKVGKGEGSQKHFLKNIEKFLVKLIENAEQTTKNIDTTALKPKQQPKGLAKCPKCQKGEIQKIKTKKGGFFGCSNFKNGCKMSLPKKIAGRQLSEKNIVDLCEKRKTNKLKGFKNKKGKKFDTQLILNDKCEVKFNFN